MTMMRIYLFVALVYICTGAFAQRGPGGVTNDFDNQKNCRLWLDAGDLTNLIDGDPVNVWHDKSISLVDDSAFWDPADASKYIQPVFRDAISAGINGKPVVSYESGGMLKIGKWPVSSGSPDLNLNASGYQTTYTQSIFVAFRTGNNVTDVQNIWEEGGYNRGFKIYIRDGHVFIAAYDDGLDTDPGGQVPRFGFSYKKQAIQSNTTYVLSYIYNVPVSNQLITNTFNPNPALYTGMTGTLNGSPFPDLMEFGCCQANGIGGVGNHPDPIGLGGHNRTSYDESGPLTASSANTGTRLFQGRLAEIGYYAYALNDAERIIVENYLAAKYFANVIQNDMFDYENDYGDGVIGIGKESNSVYHNISQGDNLFEMRVEDMAQAFPNNSPQYLMVGHNNKPIVWTNQNTPDSASIQRLKRIWRWNRHGTPSPDKQVKIRLYPEDIAKLPALPSGYSKYGILKEHTSTYLPNFNAANSTVVELKSVSINYHGNQINVLEATVNIENGTFFTLSAIKPTAQFELISDYVIEGNPPPASFTQSVTLKLNYKPASGPGAQVGFFFADGTAVDGIDYQSSPLSSVTFTPTLTTANLNFQIINNTVEDTYPTRNFKIILNPSTSNVAIGERDKLDFSIFDDDPEPKMTFVVADTAISEDATLGRIRVRILGTTTSPSQVRIVRPELTVAGTATYDVDYTLSDTNSWVSWGSKRYVDLIIPAGTNETASAYFSIIPDDLDEYDETIHFQLMSISGAGAGSGSILNHTVTITDTDLEPSVSFVSGYSEGFEAINNPRLYVSLNTPSAKEIVVPYHYAGGTATPSPLSNSDFSAPNNGVLVFQAGETEKYIPLIVYSNDESPEPDETVTFELDPNPTNAYLGSPTQHTYTIKDYTDFEWQGVAGIGRFTDNTFWMVPDAAISGNSAADIPNLSPRPITIVQDLNEKRPEVTSPANGKNNHKLIRFDGSQSLKVGGTVTKGQDPLINTGGQYDKKSIFFVFSPEVVNSTTPQVIYEQGGGGRGLSIYIIENKLYFYAWCASTNEEYSPWGFQGNSANQNSYGQAYVQSTTNLEVGQFYVVSCHYTRNMGYTDDDIPLLGGMHLYINGVREDSYTLDSDGNPGVGRIYTHSGATSIGSAWHQSRVHNKTTKGPPGGNDFAWYFHGKLGEILYYNEPQMNEVRIQILHNYLSSKYNIPLVGAAQNFDLLYADNTVGASHEAFNFDVIGIGQKQGQVHGDSQGQGELRVRNGAFTSSEGFLMTGNNGKTLMNTWPVSNAPLPGGITERSEKVWRFTSSPPNAVSAVDLYFNYSQSANAAQFQTDPDLLKLLVHTNEDPEDFSNADFYSVTPGASGPIATFMGIPVVDGMYVTLGNSSPIYPLPVTLLNFSARLTGTYVAIDWSTTSEYQCAYFDVERAGADLQWHKIAQVEGAGNSNTLQNYRLKDREPLDGISYYRLRQVDFDGKFTFSDVVSVINESAGSSEDIYLFPNPAHAGSVFLRIPYAFEAMDAEISVFGMDGTRIKTEILKSGSILRSFDCGNLSPGIYLINIAMPHLNETKKLVVR